MDVYLRPARSNDLDHLVELHMEAFADHRAARLGTAYVRAGHRWFLEQPDTIHYVAELEGGVVGFVEGAIEVWEEIKNQI